MSGKKHKGYKNKENWDRDRAEPYGTVQVYTLAALKIPILNL